MGQHKAFGFDLTGVARSLYLFRSDVHVASSAGADPAVPARAAFNPVRTGRLQSGTRVRRTTHYLAAVGGPFSSRVRARDCITSKSITAFGLFCAGASLSSSSMRRLAHISGTQQHSDRGVLIVQRLNTVP